MSDPNYFKNLLSSHINFSELQNPNPNISTFDPNLPLIQNQNENQIPTFSHIPQFSSPTWEEGSSRENYIPTFSEIPQFSRIPTFSEIPQRPPGSISSRASGSSVLRRPGKNIDLNIDTIATKKRSTWGVDEDRILVSALLNTSKDSIVGTDQSSNTFWNKVAHYYNQYSKSSEPPREVKSCKNRWHVINSQVSKFIGAYKQADSRKRSGESEDDVLAAAHGIYEHDIKKKFTLIHAWHMLRNDPKWSCIPEDGSSAKRTRINLAGNYSSSSEPGTPSTPNTPGGVNTLPISVEEDNEAVPQTTRPIGVKAAKRKGKTTSTPYSEEVEVAKLGIVRDYVNAQSKMADALDNSTNQKKLEMFERLLSKDILSEREEKMLKRLEEQLFP